MNPKPIVSNDTYCWYALYSKPRFEKKIATQLNEKQIECFLPLRRNLKKWKDRNKWVEEVVFPSYIFVRVSEKEYYEALKIPGVVRYVTFSGKAAIIPEPQMRALQQIINSNQSYIVSDKQFKPGDQITFHSGVLSGFEGELVSYLGKKKMLIRIEQIGCSILVEVPLKDME